MNVDAVSFLPAVAEPSLAPAAGNVNSPPVGGAFGSWFEHQLRELNTKMVEADRGVQKLAAGDAGNLHEVMINLQEARMSMQLMMQVRNHLLDAYHDIAQMQL